MSGQCPENSPLHDGYSGARDDAEWEEPRGILRRASTTWSTKCRRAQNVATTFKGVVENIAPTIPMIRQAWRNGRRCGRGAEASVERRRELTENFQIDDMVQYREGTGRTAHFKGPFFIRGKGVNANLWDLEDEHGNGAGNDIDEALLEKIRPQKVCVNIHMTPFRVALTGYSGAELILPRAQCLLLWQDLGRSCTGWGDLVGCGWDFRLATHFLLFMSLLSYNIC